MTQINILLLLLISSGLVFAEAVSEKPYADLGEVARWNRFVDDIYGLHKQEIRKYDIRKESRVGGYAEDLRFYREEKYYDRASGRLISVIQWERKHPDRIHSIDVYIYDKKGRILRDYSALYLTFSRNAPQQTLINLHVHNGELHAWRQFDASSERIAETCLGSYKGKKVDIEMDDLDIIDATDVKDGPFSKPDYKACFRGLPVELGRFLRPQ